MHLLFVKEVLLLFPMFFHIQYYLQLEYNYSTSLPKNQFLLKLGSLFSFLSSLNTVLALCVFPALYCFRQYIELTIKFTLNNYGEEITDTHNISALFDALRKYIHPNPEVQNISRLLHELSDIDYNGCTFRYNRVLYKDSKNQEFQQAIDVETLKIRLIQIYKFFYGILEEINIAKEINYEQ